MKSSEGDQKIVWYKDLKFLLGVFLIIFSFVMGLLGKIMSISQFYNPIYLITGISIWAFSFVVFFLGVFLVGWETARIIQSKIKQQVNKTVKKTYNYTKDLPGKGIKKMKEMTK